MPSFRGQENFFRYIQILFQSERKLMKKHVDDETIGHFVSCKTVSETSREKRLV